MAEGRTLHRALTRRMVRRGLATPRRLDTDARDGADDPDATRTYDTLLLAAVWALCIWVVLRQ